MMNHGLSEATVDKITGVLAQFPEISQAIIYGSRAKGNFKPGSDIDLTLHGDRLTSKLCNDIAQALDDLLLPYMIDLSVFALLSHPELEAHINRVGRTLYKRAD
jgi:uncharacterized protein